MALDPQVAALYGRQPAGPGIHTLPIETARARLDAAFNDHAQFPAVSSVTDHTVPCTWGALPVRVYTPGPGGNRPLLLFFHGGGFCLHNIASHDSLCRALCNAGACVVVSVGYRLAPEFPFPACMEDGYAALEWAHQNAAALGGNPDAIALAGDSAGANICAVMSLMARERGPHIKLQILCYGPAGCIPDEESESVYAFGGGEYVLPRAMLDWCMGFYLPHGHDPKNPYLNPGQAADLTGLPKTYAITAEYDPLRDDGEAFADKLRAAGNAVTQERIPGMMHGFLLYWNQFDAAGALIERIGRMIQDTFSGK